jgi:hypothetical protein
MYYTRLLIFYDVKAVRHFSNTKDLITFRLVDELCLCVVGYSIKWRIATMFQCTYGTLSKNINNNLYKMKYTFDHNKGVKIWFRNNMILLALICKLNVAVKSLAFHRNIQHAATHFLRRQGSAPFFKYERLNYVPPRGRTVLHSFNGMFCKILIAF